MNNQRSTADDICPNCGQRALVAFTRNEDFTIELSGRQMQVRAQNVPVKRCVQCGEVLIGPDAAKAEDEAIRRTAGLLFPNEIIGIRETFGWSQQQLADLTGFSADVIALWERGRQLPGLSDNKILQAIRDCPPFRDYLQNALLLNRDKEATNHVGGSGAAAALTQSAVPTHAV